MTEEQKQFEKEMNLFTEMMYDFSLCQEDYC